jgi:hypothetical protein
MKYMCSFKFSQDHIELFFGKIRSLLGCNNNPSAKQFIGAYRKLLVHSDVQDVVRGNCLQLQIVPILTASSKYIGNENVDVPSVSVLNNSTSRNRIVEPQENSVTDHDYFLIPDSSRLSTCSQSIVAYIAGFVVFKLKNSLHCETCISALNTSTKHEQHALISLKTKGALIFPSKDVLDICILCEKLFRINVEHNKNDSLSLSNVRCHSIMQSILKTYLHVNIFSSLTNHMMECSPTENHLVLLIKAIAEKYLQVRYWYAGKRYSAWVKGKKKNTE